MTVVIVDEAPDPSVVKRVICRNCGIKLEYTPNDVTKEYRTDYGGGGDTYYYINCPKCKKDITVAIR